MATRSEAKLAIWEASDKSPKAREFLAKFLAENSEDGPRGFVADSKVEQAVKSVRSVKAEKK